MAFLSPGASFSGDGPSLNLLSNEDLLLAQGSVPGTSPRLLGTEPDARPEAVAGPAADPVAIGRPLPGSPFEIVTRPGAVYRLTFEAESARVAIQDRDLILLFQDGGEIRFADFADLAARGAAPLLEVDGVIIGGDLLLEQVALATNGLSEGDGQSAFPTLETAAAPPQGGGGSRYQDDLGDSLGLLSPEGPIPFTALAFGLLSTDLRLPEEFILTALEPPLLPTGAPSGTLLVNPDGESPAGLDPDDGGSAGGGLFAGSLAEDTPAPATLTAAVADPAGQDVLTEIQVTGLPTAAQGWTMDLTALQAEVAALGGTVDLSGLDQGTLVIQFSPEAGVRSFSAPIGLTPPVNSDLDHTGVDVLVTAQNLVTGAISSGGTQDISVPVDAIVDGTELLLDGSVIGPGSVVTGNRGAVTALGLTITDLQDQTSLAGDTGDADAPYTQGGGDSDGSETVTRIEVTLDVDDASMGLPSLSFNLPAGVEASETSSANAVTTIFTIAPGTSIADVNALVESFAVNAPDPTFSGDVAVTVTTRTEETALTDGEVTLDNNVDIDSYGFTLRYGDDAPAASPDQADVTDALDINLTLVIDRSSSMGEDSGVAVQDVTLPEGITDPAAFLADPNNVLGNGNFTRLGLLKVALVELLDAYGTGGAEVNVLIVQFDELAETLGSGWIEGDLQAAIDAIVGIEIGFGTNYTAAVEETMAAYPDGTPAADQNLVYFLSDGKPTRGGGNPPNTDNSIPDAVVAQWEAFLGENLMEAIAVGIGQGVDAADSDLEDVAGPNHPNDDNPLIVLDEDDLIPTLVETVDNRVSGNVLENDDFGDDGAGAPKIVTLSVDGIDYVFDGDRIVNQSNGNVTLGSLLTVTTTLGGALTFDFDDGDFSYSAPQVSQTETEVFSYTIQDQDGDRATSDLTITIRNQELPPSATGDRVLTNSQAVEIDDAWLVYNDGPEGSRLGVAEVFNAAGGDAEGGFIDPAVSFTFDQSQASFQYRAHDFVQTSDPASVELTLQTGSQLAGSNGDEIVVGGPGVDTIDGNAGNDVVAGEAGDDVIQGGDGDDLVVGGAGQDTLTGNDGADSFSYRAQDIGAGKDTILDFNFDDDVIDLAELLDGFNAGDDIDDFVRLDIQADQILVDSDGTQGGAAFQSIARLAGEGVSIGDVLTVITDFEGNSVTVDAS